MSGMLGEGLLGGMLLGDGSTDGTFAFGQAQAYIFNDKVFGQAQARILQTYFGFSQAQAQIKQTYRGFAQAQGYLQPRGFGQAQATIIAFDVNQHAQARARIKRTEFGFAQSNAWISERHWGLGQAQGTIYAVVPIAGQAQAYIFQDKLFGQAQGKIWYPAIQGYGQAQAQIKERYFGQAQALIDSSIKSSFGQAQGLVCRLDTFTRVTTFGLGTGYTWIEADTAFNAAEDSTYHIDGSKLINSPDINFDWDSYQIDSGIPDRATISFEFTTNSSFVDFPYLGVVFGTDYDSDLPSLVIYSNGDPDWFLSTDWGSGAGPDSVPITILPNKTYRAKLSYNEVGNIAAKVWDISGLEPDWQINGTIPNYNSANTDAWIDLYFAQDIVSFDNLQICAFEPFDVITTEYGFGQAAALIHRTQGYGQAQGYITNFTANGCAQAYVAWESGTAPFRDTFSRTTVSGLGSPRYLWTPINSEFDHPAATTVSLNGSKVVVPAGVEDSYYLGYTFGYHNTFEVEFNITSTAQLFEQFYYEFIIPGSEEILIRLWRGDTTGIISLEVYRGPSFVAGGTFGVGIGLYRILVRWHPNLLRTEIWKNGNFQTSSSGAVPMPNNFGNTNLLIRLIGAPTQSLAIFDSLYLDTGTFSHGLARAKIKREGNTRHAQAQARIKGIPKQPAQAQAFMFGLGYGIGNVQAIIDFNLTVGWGQAQAHISIRHYSFAQARARIKTQRWAWGQSQGFIKPRYSTGQSQGYIFALGSTRYGQTQARIKQTSYSFGQSQASINQVLATGQAQGLILSAIKSTCGQARAKIAYDERKGFSQAQAGIKSRSGVASGNARVLIATFGTQGYGQAQALIKKTIGFGQAQGWIFRTEAGYLVKYNNYILPGYLQSEALISEEGIYTTEVDKYDFSTFSEYTGLKNKLIEIELLVVDSTYGATKEQIQKASTMLRSSREDFVRLTLKRPDRYYLALTKSISTGQTAGRGEDKTRYKVTFEAKPWAYGTTRYELTGSIDTDNVNRTLSNGTWSPALVRVTGTNITVSGYTDTGDFTGFISASGTVNDLVIDSESYTATMGGVNRNDLMNNLDYQIYIGPGRTRFTTTGITEITIEYEDRWSL